MRTPVLRTPRSQPEETVPAERRAALESGQLPLGEQFEIVCALRRQSSQAGERLDRYFLGELERLRAGLAEAKGLQDQLKDIVQRLTAPPWHSAVFLGLAPGRPSSALVLHNGARRVVSLANDVDPSRLAAGDEVLLGHELNVVMAASPDPPRSGVIAVFDRRLEDGRLVLRSRDEEALVEASGHLEADLLRSGDLVRWDRQAWMAFERVERSRGMDRFLEATPAETFAQVGGLDRQIEQLQRSIRLHLYHPDVVREYGLRRKGSVLLVGPPGTGKTLLAKALANWVAQISRSGRSRFVNIKPAGLHEMWYGKTEENYREAFRIAREAGAAEPEVPVVMFFDEVDAIGTTRGGAISHVDDRVLNAFMTELDGLEARGNILVVAATNRREALDPALLRPGRLGDLELEVPRPRMAGARDIFAKYLPAHLPYGAATRRDGDEARRAVIEAAVSQIYAPNADNLLATLVLRDGKERVVKAAELMSGASIAKIAGDAAERVGLRKIEGGDPAIHAADLQAAVADELERLARALTPASCRKHLPDLPYDVDVVRATPSRHIGRQCRYTRAA